VTRDIERRAYVCTHKDHVVYAYRVFLMPGDPEPPRCPEHGKMQRQANAPYFKQKGKKR
jgi:hypothetical protein